MRTIIAGSREGVTFFDVDAAVGLCGWKPSVVISGIARGADKLGEQVASDLGIPIERFPVDWNTHGKAAGYIRNKEMAEKAEALIAVWDGKSKGTKHMIDIALAKGLKVYIHRV